MVENGNFGHRTSVLTALQHSQQDVGITFNEKKSGGTLKTHSIYFCMSFCRLELTSSGVSHAVMDVVHL